ncbi:SGNH/GDSL hydrolase family protein [Sphingobacterium faecium]|uniref:SGNH/GDSL hydrolase family protein n=1 Tax=Sphingobacterium faecium TaxID=34087 RepID=UPI0024698F6A|nr:SGNH/GDSL hydrolase family protein [Sphingobacterium faecium]MDH5825939.1 SGNH/GDSL hydrolase family protein [Sphingobacterium faecium]
MKKNYSTSWCLVISFSVLLLNGFVGKAQQITPFKQGDRVVFLGNSITDGGHYHAYIWLYYMTRFPNMNLEFLNAGIGGDKASDMVKRLDGDVFSKKPTVLVSTFGMNDSGYFEYNESEPEKFANEKVKESHDAFKQMEKRFKELPKTRIVLVGSSPYDETAMIAGNTAFKNKNKAMLRIVDFQKQSAQANKWEFFDYNTPITALNKQFQQTDPEFTISGNDRIHPDNDGHMVMAYLFLKAQGWVGQKVAAMSLDAKNMKASAVENCKISNIKKASDGMSFDYLAGSLPYPLDTVARGWGSKKSQFMATKVVPFMEEMNQELLTVKGLEGSYQLFIDEETIGTWSAADYEKGINLANLNQTPQYQQAIRIMHLNEERWEIERRFRDYAWVQYNFFQPKGLLDANNRKAIEVLDQYKEKDGWLNAKRDLYSKAMFPEVRKAWQGEMDVLLALIKETGHPLKRKFTLVKVS